MLEDLDKRFMVGDVLVVLKKLSDSNQCLYDNKKTLIIDYTESTIVLKLIDNDKLKEIIDIYLKKNEFDEEKTIKFKELFKFDKFRIGWSILEYFVNKVFGNNVIKNLEESKVTKVLLTLLGFFLLYFFYQLGYAFLYGFYLGGNSDDKIPIIDMYVNPIPFSIKSVVAIGIAFLIYVAIVLIPVFGVLYSNKLKHKIIYFFILIFSEIAIIITCVYVFIGSGSGDDIMKLLYLFILLLAIPSTILILVLWLRFFQQNTLTFFSCFIYTLIIISILLGQKTNLKYKEFNQLIAFASVFLFPIVLMLLTKIVNFSVKKIFNKLYDTKLYKTIKELFLYFPVFVVIFGIFSTVMKSLKITVPNFINISLIVIYLITVILKNIDKTKQILNFIKITKKLEKNEENSQNNIAIEDNETKNNKNGISILVSGAVIIVLIFSLIICIFIPYTVATTGRIIRESILDLSKDRIIYDNGNKTVVGRIVAETGDKYYISKYPERTLMTISSSDIITVPCEYYSFKYDANQFKFLNDDYILRNYTLKTNSLVKSETSSKNEKDNFYYGYTIKLYNNNNEVLFESEIGFICPIKEIKKGTNYGIVLINSYKGRYSPNNSVQNEIQKIISGYQDFLLKFCKLPKLSTDETEYYFKNIVLEHSKVYESNKEIEKYIYSLD